MSIQIVTPPTINYAQWDWNPKTTISESIAAGHRMALMDKENERLQQKQALDEEVKRTMLPYEIEESKAKVAQTLALRDLATSRAREGADDISAAAYAAKYQGGDIDRLLGRPADVGKGSRAFSLPRPSSNSNLAPSSSNAPTSFSLNPLTSNFSQDEETTLGKIASELPSIPDSELDAVTSPKPSEMTASTDGAGQAVNFGPTQRNRADWDNNPSNFSSLEVKDNPLTSLQVPDKMREDLVKANDKSGALNQPQQQAEKQEVGLGEMLVGEFGKIEDALALGAKSKGEAKARFYGAAAGASDELAKRTAYALGMDPSLGKQTMQVLLKGSNGLTRDPAAINRIVELTQEGVSPSEAAELYDMSRRAQLEQKLKGKTVEDKTVDELAKLNATRAALKEQPDSPGKLAQMEILDEKENLLTGGRANYNRHVDIEKGVSTALASSNDRNLNYKGQRFDSPEAKEDAYGQLSGNDFLIQKATEGSLPTVTRGKDGVDTSVAYAYLKKHGVDSTPVGIWESGKLNIYRYKPSAETGKQFVPLMVKGPEVAKKSVDGNPFAPLSDELNAKAQEDNTNDSRGENEKRYLQLVQERNALSNPNTDRTQLGRGGVTSVQISGTPQEEAQKLRDSWDKKTAKIQEVEKQLGAFDPEGSGYDIKTAVAAGMEPDSKTKHWGSVRKSTPDEIKKYGVPEDSYLLLKGAKHPTHNLAVQYEAQRGFEIKKFGDRYFSVPVKK